MTRSGYKVGQQKRASRDRRVCVKSTPASNDQDAIDTVFSTKSIAARIQDAAKQLFETSSQGDDDLFAAANTIYLTDDKQSWLYHVPGWHWALYNSRDPQLTRSEWFDELWELHPANPGVIKIFGREVPTPRFQQAYGVSHRFSGKTFEARAFPDAVLFAVEQIQRLVPKSDSSSESFVNGGLLNWYASGDHYIGPHSDDIGGVVAGSPVFSVTFGATRRFVVAPKKSKRQPSAAENGARQVELQLADGDLLVMGGTTQATHKHSLPRAKSCLGRRINLSLRCFAE